MHALSVLQPWATLIALGLKRIETRSWHTSYRGRLAVHASSRQPPRFYDLCHGEPFRTMLLRSPWNRPPQGVVLGTVELRDCVRVEELGPDALTETERAFGDFSAGRWAWLLADVQPLEQPVPLRGRLGLFEIGFLVDEPPGLSGREVRRG
jgi:hypothetical protein